MRARDVDGLLGLFAEHAVTSLPDGRTLQGREAIRWMFTSLFGSMAPCPTCLAQIVGPRAIAAEIETVLPDGAVRRTANFFDLIDRGAITGVRSYARS